MKQTKLEALIGSAISKRIRHTNFMRLVNGDLSHLGDALVDGERVEILTRTALPGGLTFTQSADFYAIRADVFNNIDLPILTGSFDALGRVQGIGIGAKND